MQITRAADIGLRMLMVLASEPEKQTTIRELSIELEVPDRHLGKVVQKLAGAGWILTARGRGGGIRVSPAGELATAADVLIEMEGNRPVVNCDEPPCPLLSRACRLRRSLDAAQEAFLAELRGVTVAELSRLGPSGVSLVLGQ